MPIVYSLLLLFSKLKCKSYWQNDWRTDVRSPRPWELFTKSKGNDTTTMHPFSKESVCSFLFKDTSYVIQYKACEKLSAWLFDLWAPFEKIARYKLRRSEWTTLDVRACSVALLLLAYITFPMLENLDPKDKNPDYRFDGSLRAVVTWSILYQKISNHSRLSSLFNMKVKDALVYT